MVWFEYLRLQIQIEPDNSTLTSNKSAKLFIEYARNHNPFNNSITSKTQNISHLRKSRDYVYGINVAGSVFKFQSPMATQRGVID